MNDLNEKVVVTFTRRDWDELFQAVKVMNMELSDKVLDRPASAKELLKAQAKLLDKCFVILHGVKP